LDHGLRYILEISHFAISLDLQIVEDTRARPSRLDVRQVVVELLNAHCQVFFVLTLDIVKFFALEFTLNLVFLLLILLLVGAAYFFLCAEVPCGD
jgi:hypothetical protein